MAVIRQQWKLTWEVSCLLLYKHGVFLNHCGAQAWFFILLGSLSSGKPEGCGENGYEKEAVALGGGGTYIVTNNRAVVREPDE